MINRRKRILLTIVSGIVLLLVSGISSTYAQTEDDRPSQPKTLSGRIKWKKDMGLLPSGFNSTTPSTNICSQFYVVVTQMGKGPQPIASDSTLVAKTSVSEPDFYYCDFEMTVPNNRSLVVTAGMGEASSFPKTSGQPFHYTLPWVRESGTRAGPPSSYVRSFAPPSRSVTLGTKGMWVTFELVYTPKP